MKVLVEILTIFTCGFFMAIVTMAAIESYKILKK